MLDGPPCIIIARGGFFYELLQLRVVFLGAFLHIFVLFQKK